MSERSTIELISEIDVHNAFLFKLFQIGSCWFDLSSFILIIHYLLSQPQAIFVNIKEIIPFGMKTRLMVQ